MTHKEENIVNITVKAMELLNAGKIRQDEDLGFMGFTQEIVSLAERFEREYGHIDWNIGNDDYWVTIDAFSEKALLEMYGPDVEQKQVAALHVKDADGIDAYLLVEPYDLYRATGLLSAIKDFNRPAAFLMDEAVSTDYVHRISEEKFKDLVHERMENTGRITGVFEMDFEYRVFSAVSIMDGWVAWKFDDILEAHKEAAKSNEDPLRALVENLSGKELSYVNHPGSDINILSQLPLDEQVSLFHLPLEEQVKIAKQKIRNSATNPPIEPER